MKNIIFHITDDVNYRWLALIITSLATLTSVLNASTLIIALPTIMVNLNTSLIGVMWVLIIYILILTILAPAWGRMADIYGRKRLYLYGIACFTIGSLLCGFAPDINLLILFRIVQAIGGSILVANSTIIVADAFPRGELGRAMGILSMIMAAAFVLGPILGGLLTLIDWRLNFFFNVPLGVIAYFGARKWLRDMVTPTSHEAFDWIGMILFSVALITLLIYVSAGFIPGFFSPEMLLLLAVGLLSFFGFIRHELRISYPLMDLHLFRIRTFAFGQFSALLNSIARGAVMILLILYFQGVKGDDPLTASIYVAPMAIGLVITGPIGGYLSDRYGSRIISSLGLIISLAGLIGLAMIRFDTPYWFIALMMLINGLGSGLFQSPNTSAIMASVPPDRRGITSSIRSLFMNLGMALSMAFAMPILLGSVSMDKMMEMFVIGGTNMSLAIQQAVTAGITSALWISCIITIPAIIVSVMRGTDIQHEG